MYEYRPCPEPDCARSAFLDDERCLHHAGDPEGEMARAIELLRSSDEIRNLNLGGIRLDGLDLSGKSFICCSFAEASLQSVLFTRSHFKICFFDGADIVSCDFSGIDAQFSSFGSARILNSSFEHSELLHINFCGARIEDCTFSNSNLYDSRFIKTEIVTTAFEDCDLKRVHLIPASEVGVSYRYSNTAEAIRDLDHAWQ
ncbi:MAG: pentapeptide repeat-containing protein [Treponema sp.]|nr:pentapeptide repeat-containing protein [Treponema sp.]